MRLSRTCYDKPHRCPGGRGGGLKYARTDKHNCNGTIRVEPLWPKLGLVIGGPGAIPWKFGYCTQCDVRTWPTFTHWLDPSWLACEARTWMRDLRYWRQDRT